jgi:hypothetical protein
MALSDYTSIDMEDVARGSAGYAALVDTVYCRVTQKGQKDTYIKMKLNRLDNSVHENKKKKK